MEDKVVIKGKPVVLEFFPIGLVYLIWPIAAVKLVQSGTLTKFWVLLASVVIVPKLLMLIDGALLQMRTLTFDKDGCTIQILGFSRTIAWDDFKGKVFFNYVLRDKDNKRSVVFSLKPIPTEVDLHYPLNVYRMTFNYFSLVYVDLLPKEILAKANPKSLFGYIAEEEFFTAKMDEWGLIILEREYVDPEDLEDEEEASEEEYEDGEIEELEDYEPELLEEPSEETSEA